MNHAGGTREALDHDGMDHGTVDHAMHGEGGFMSMVAMTADLPRSADGLPMEWFEAPFGPLFPGLPAGLDVTFTLDGDGVASVALTTGVTGRGLEATWVGPVDTFPARLARGGSRPRPEGVPYLTELAVPALAGLRSLVLAGTRAPVGFFAYPGMPSVLADPSTSMVGLATPEEDVLGALEALASLLEAGPVATAPAERVALPTGGALDLDSLSAIVGALLPDGAVVVDESVSASFMLFPRTEGAGEHDYLFITGGAIGWGLPVATGAAFGAPDRPVICLQADGSAMYTIQSLWTQAREGLDVTTIIVANRSYAILEFEFARVGASGSGTAARELMDLRRPALSFAGLASSMGVPARRVDDVAGMVAALRDALSSPGPNLIEAVIA